MIYFQFFFNLLGVYSCYQVYQNWNPMVDIVARIAGLKDISHGLIFRNHEKMKPECIYRRNKNERETTKRNMVIQ